MINQQQQLLLRKNLLFTSFSADDFASIVSKTRHIQYDKSRIIFSANQPANHFFLLLKGSVKLSLSSADGDEKIIHIINPGNTFAEAIMFLEQTIYPVSATALDNINILAINVETYLGVLRRSPKACLNIMASMSQKLHWMVREIDRLNLHDSTYRLVYFLLDNVEQSSQASPSVSLSMSKQALASYLSIRPETLSRILNKLMKNGLLKVYKNHIDLLAIDQLKELITP